MDSTPFRIYKLLSSAVVYPSYLKQKDHMKTLFIASILLLSSCASQNKTSSKLNKAFIEQSIRTNHTSKTEVIELLGHPEMVNSSSDGDEQWVYAKGSSEHEAGYGGIGTTMLGVMGTTLTGLDISTANYSSSTSTKTTTLTIYFNKKSKVTKYNFSSSRF